MNKSFKRFISTMLVACMAMSMVAGAAGTEEFIGTAGESMAFSSVDDETGTIEGATPFIGTTRAVTNQELWRRESIRGGATYIERALFTREGLRIKEFVRYLTGSWAGAREYAYTEAETVSWEYNGGLEIGIADSVRATLGLSKSRTTQFSATTTIPADPSKLSKLGFASDYKYIYYNYIATAGGITVTSSDEWFKSPTATTYLVAYYK